MKKYCDYFNEITQDELFEGLLGYGLFTSKLPDIFSSESFYQYCKKNNPSYEFKKWHEYIKFESMRNTNFPRVLGIPVPFSYYNLCKFISDNKSEFSNHFEKMTLSDTHKISRIHLRKMYDTKSLFEMNYEHFPEDISVVDDLMIGTRYMVKADISTCFPSIYTHALSWALVGKENAKANAGKSFWYNALDKVICCCKNGETHGLLIGPHVYNLISEIILTTVDHELSSKYKYIRNIDDYSCYVESFEEAEKFIKDLNSILGQYELMLNWKKTQIIKLPLANMDNWQRQLCNYVFDTYLDGKDEYITYKSVRSYLDLAVDLMKENGENAAILNYAIKVLANKKMSNNAQTLYMKECCHLSIIYPYLIPILEKSVFDVVTLDYLLLKSFLEKAYSLAENNNNYETMYYCLYYAMKYKISLDCIRNECIIKTNSPILKVVAYKYYLKNAMNYEISELKKDALNLKTYNMDGNWIFIYELLDESQLSDEWKEIKKNKISFLK